MNGNPFGVNIRATHTHDDDGERYELEFNMTFTEPVAKSKLQLMQVNLQCMGMNQNKCMSDGYHTFDELYKHRITLYITLLKTLAMLACQPLCPAEIRNAKFRKFKHYEGWFCLGAEFPGIGQVSYHLPEYMWDRCSFANNIEWAFDGHTSNDVLERLEKIAGLM